MISFLRRHQKSLFIAVIIIFLLGTFVGLGGYLFTSRDMSMAVASVGPVKIPYSRFAARLNQYTDAMRSRGSELGDEAVAEIKQSLLRDMIVDELLHSKALEWGIPVTDQELARDIQNTPAFQRGGAFSQELYFQAVRQVLRETPEAFEAERRKAVQAAKLKALFYQTAKLTPAELREAYAAANKGSMKGFEKDKDSFAARARQQRAIELINYYLRQLSTQTEIRSYLEQRERGV